MALHDRLYRIGLRLRHARKSTGLTLEQVADRVGMSVPSLSAYETGQREPSFAQLAKLAKVYHRPIEFFLSEGPLPKETVVWRVKPQSPQAEELESQLLELGRRYHALEEWNGFVRSYGLPKFAFPAESGEVAGLASRVRRFLGLGDRPGTGLLLELENVGVKVFHLAFEPRNASASIVGETFGPTVLLNSLASRRERIYALAQALFYLLTGGQFGEGDTEKVAALADHFASCLLLPDEPVRLAVDHGLRDGKMAFRELDAIAESSDVNPARAAWVVFRKFRELDAIAKSFDVPSEPFLWRVGELFGRSPENTRRDVLSLRADSSFVREPPEPASTRPERFVRLALKTYEDGKLALGRLADYLGISRQEAMRRFFHDGRENLANEEISLAPSGR